MIICEIGLNHMGDVKYANEYIDKIIKSESDGVLFHIREESFYKKHPELLLLDEFYIKAIKKLHKHNLKFGITLADPNKVKFFRKLEVDFYKIFSRDILYEELIKKIILTKKKVFVSTCISDYKEIKKFVKMIKNKKNQITLIHTYLGKDISKVNLKAIPRLKEKFQMNVGYGNHAENYLVIYLSLVFQPSDIIFYVKGSKYKHHIDDLHAVQLDNLQNFIKNLKVLPDAIGNISKIKLKI